MIYVRSQPPEETPVSRAELKAHLRREADDTFEDMLLDAYLNAAVDHLDGRDGILGRCLCEQEWQLLADTPDGRGGFDLDLGPVRNDLLIALHRRSAGAWVAVDANAVLVVQRADEMARVQPAPGHAWPSADAVPNAWRVTFTAGYGLPAHVPAALRAAILLLAADLYGDRSGKSAATLVANPTVDRLIAPYRRISV